MVIGYKPEGSWFDEKVDPSVPTVFNLLMDPMEKIDRHSHEWGYEGRKFFATERCGHLRPLRRSWPCT